MRLPLAPSALFPFSFDASVLHRVREAALRWRPPSRDALRVAIVFTGIYAASWLAAMTAAVIALSA